jgi:hypothetical protein
MSKKIKRQVSRQYVRPVTTVAPKTAEFNPDYTIIKHELTRIGILAASFVAVLVILAIFQNQLLGVFLK